MRGQRQAVKVQRKAVPHQRPPPLCSRRPPRIWGPQGKGGVLATKAVRTQRKGSDAHSGRSTTAAALKRWSTLSNLPTCHLFSRAKALPHATIAPAMPSISVRFFSFVPRQCRRSVCTTGGRAAGPGYGSSCSARGSREPAAVSRPTSGAEEMINPVYSTDMPSLWSGKSRRRRLVG